MKKKPKNKLSLFFAAFLCLTHLLFANDQKDNIEFSAEKIDIKPEKNEENIFRLIGNAKINNANFSITADEITVLGKNSEKIEAKSNVTLIEKESGIVAKGFTLSYYRLSGRLQMSGNVKIENSKENFTARSSYIEIPKENAPITLRASVRIFQDNFFARSDSAVYNKNNSQLLLVGNTYLSREGEIYRTDRTSINLKTKEIVLEGGVSGSMDDERVKLDQS